MLYRLCVFAAILAGFLRVASSGGKVVLSFMRPFLSEAALHCLSVMPASNLRIKCLESL